MSTGATSRASVSLTMPNVALTMMVAPPVPPFRHSTEPQAIGARAVTWMGQGDVTGGMIRLAEVSKPSQGPQDPSPPGPSPASGRGRRDRAGGASPSNEGDPEGEGYLP